MHHVRWVRDLTKSSGNDDVHTAGTRGTGRKASLFVFLPIDFLACLAAIEDGGASRTAFSGLAADMTGSLRAVDVGGGGG